MNQQELERELIAVARADAPSDRVPYAFEKRIMARLQALPAVDVLGSWARSLTRAAALCVAVMVFLSAWAYLNSVSGTVAGTDLSQEFENTVLAAADQDQAVETIW